MKTYLYAVMMLLSSSLFAQDLQKDMTTMLSYLNGEFDNFPQTYLENEKPEPDSMRHEHIHTIFKPIVAPELGKNVLLVKQYSKGDTNNIYRQRIYTFVINEPSEAVQLDVWSFVSPDAEKKYADPAMLKYLSTGDLRYAEGCAIFWKGKGATKKIEKKIVKKKGKHSKSAKEPEKEPEIVQGNDKFIGSTNKNCAFQSKRLNTKVTVWDTLQLTSTTLSIHDIAKDATNKTIFKHKSGTPFQLTKCRFFKGKVTIKGDTSFYVTNTLRLHDLGQRASFTLPDPNASKYTAELIQLATTSGYKRLRLSIYDATGTTIIASQEAESTAKNITLDSPKIKADFVLEEPFKNDK
jgi:CpeT/CpcT family (DUF1001)